ncbi:VWA domain-containing protein [Noviherbaspirillum suwonense]|jgi:Ca-activated chloride channel family protein|uniref:Ca-activated chloride channel family protein n=1 Tax=Noviherbaspirillum suwonense TaxID=1224511 RepID=A0ABY1PTU9_9BURK|nr:VWA domain-containing protein [Noviherbaspirillum suwonense]SMP45967.1 Ca-activated chloride channel family protein [Noviherbaspirillum suwonense]
MTFLWPEMLFLLLLAPLLLGLYLWLLRRKKKAAVRYASLAMVREAMGPAQRMRRHIPPILFLLSIIVMLLAVARPAAVVTLPSMNETVILAIDVSGSMRANDVQPSRLAAAQAAARAFIEDQPQNTRIGVVSFAGTASLVQAPTRTKEDLLAAIDRFQLQRGTAVGSGILVSLKALIPEVEFDLQSDNPRPTKREGGSRSLDKQQPAPNQAAEFRPVAPGSYSSAVIILLTDGQTTTGPDPIESAKMAAERGVRVFTVGVGTVSGEILGEEGWSMRVRLDEDALKDIAKTTSAQYFYAGTATDLTNIYKSLNSRLVMEKKSTEITALFAALAAVLAVLSAMLSMLWFNRIL